MDKILEKVKKELEEIGEQGLTSENLEMTSKLTEIYKNLVEAEEEQSGMGRYSGYGTRSYRDGYGNYDDYDDYRGDYGRRGVPGSGRGRYRDGGGGHPGSSRMRDHLDKVADGMDMYEYGRDRYQHGGDEERMYEGLEKLMFGLCMFVESAMDFAESPQEKEIIRKHIRKMQDW